MEQSDYNLLFRWFVVFNIDEAVSDPSTFSFNRERLFDEEGAQQFFDNTVLVAQPKQLTSNEHFSVATAHRSSDTPFPARRRAG
ncbi:transposase-like protein DUF772 [Tahibacter aquaticus]|uniref:Transposase-like protein DUF772 n=1 Tax=Tahibacter aquaticus TaxID=520092 RepID=A0A4R6ZA10_9GAMM|nr:transposase [Tahibacter aquaticus]TDR48652.1 transposase-like protein DUF772 [Tahibacter aquaticus]